MFRSSRFKSLFRLGMLLAMVFAVQLLPARAADPASVSVSFGNLNFGTVTIGMSFPLYIDVSGGSNGMRSTTLKCFQNGTALSASSISQLPNQGLFVGLHTQQYYRAVAAGTVSIVSSMALMLSRVTLSRLPAVLMASMSAAKNGFM